MLFIRNQPSYSLIVQFEPDGRPPTTWCVWMAFRVGPSRNGHKLSLEGASSKCLWSLIGAVWHKRIIMPSPPMFTQKPFPRNIPTVICISVPFVCVGGRERDQTVVVTMVIRALLAWFDCQECGQKKKKRKREGGIFGLWWGREGARYRSGKKWWKSSKVAEQQLTWSF